MEKIDLTKSNPKAVKLRVEDDYIIMYVYKKDDPEKTIFTVSRELGGKYWYIHDMRGDCRPCDNPSAGEDCGRIQGFRMQEAYERAYNLFVARQEYKYEQGAREWLDTNSLFFNPLTEQLEEISPEERIS